jgi:triacylglycerol lipase
LFIDGTVMIVPKLRSPVILVHGLLGFDEIKLCGYTLASYFPGIPELLRRAGNLVHVARVGKTCGVAERAAHLKSFINREVPNEPVHVMAHSMGGLDARYMVSRLGMADRVLSLTTLGTPHRGTSFADWGVRRLNRIVAPLLDLFSIPCQAFYDLTTRRCQQFNEEVPDAPGVRYFSVAGRHDGAWRSFHWKFLHTVVRKEEGENDGVVSLDSARYGESCEVWDGDHLSLVNWPDPTAQAVGKWEDRTPRYGQLIRRLADEGF